MSFMGSTGRRSSDGGGAWLIISPRGGENIVVHVTSDGCRTRLCEYGKGKAK